MGRIGVSITKSVSFRGVAQEFSNTYYYEFATDPTAAIATDIINIIVTKEKAMHSSAVSFLRARAWSAGGTKEQNNMLVQMTLSGNGSQSTAGTLDRERAVLVRFRAGSDSRGRPVYLRKWWHLDVGAMAGSSFAPGVYENTAQLNTTQRDGIVAHGDFFKVLNPTALSGVGGANLVSDKGRQISGATVAHPYLEHHQLGDMWRT